MSVLAEEEVGRDEELWRGLKPSFLSWDAEADRVSLAPELYYRRRQDLHGLTVERSRFYERPEEVMKDYFVGLVAISAADVLDLAPGEITLVPKEDPRSANVAGLPRSPLMEEATP